MNALSPEAYAVVEGRHPDPFHYLGPHVEDDVPVVRVFLPNASEVSVVDERGSAFFVAYTIPVCSSERWPMARHVIM